MGRRDDLLALGLALLVAGAMGLACHPPGEAEQRDPGRCATCHLPEYVATKEPMHAGKKPATCGVCHADTSWRPSRLEHPFWALTGAHEQAACTDCHHGWPPVLRGTSKACDACHHADFDRAQFPGHAKFPLTCEECHTTTVWKPSTWKTLPPEPEPEPTAPSATPAEHPSPKPVPKGAPRPKPRPAPSGAPSVAPSSSGPPDVITRPSRRR